MLNKRYVAVPEPDVWLAARPEPMGVEVMLPEYLAVELTSSSGGREVFSVAEGVHAGRTFSLLSVHLRPGNPGWRGPARLSFNIGKQRLNFPGGQVRARTSAANPIAPGTHVVHLPDRPHDVGGGSYTSACSWFYVGRGAPPAAGDAGYLNTLRSSEGGITVEAADWPPLYEYLIRCRGADGRSIGSILVLRV